MDISQRNANETAVLALIRADNLAGAEARLRRMLAENSQDGRALALLAHCRLRADDKAEALTAARSAVAIEPDDWMVRRVLLGALSASERHAEADKLARDLLSEEPQDGSTLLLLAEARMNGKLYALDAADIVEAHALIDAAEANAGDDAHTLIDLAMFRVHQWRWADAEALARRALTIDPTHPEIFRVLAECALARKAANEAFDLAIEALRFNPTDRATMQLLARAKARRRPWLKPLWPFIDWIVEMDRAGLIGFPVMLAVLAWALWVAVGYDLTRSAAGQTPVVIFSLGLCLMLLVGGVSYGVALAARLGIARDLRKVELPKF